MSFGPPMTPPIIQHLIIANLAVFIAQHALGGVSEYGAVRPYLVWQMGYVWQPFSYMWLHGGLGHILMNMFMLWMFGSQVALAWGPKKFLRYYVICGVGAGVIIATWPYLFIGIDPSALLIPTVGASGAIYGVLLAYSLIWPDRTIALLFPPITFRAIWLIPGMFLMTLMFGGGGISHIGHLGGVIVGWLYMRRGGEAGAHTLSIASLKHRYKRHRMRQKLRAVQYEDAERNRRNNDRRLH